MWNSAKQLVAHLGFGARARRGHDAKVRRSRASSNRRGPQRHRCALEAVEQRLLLTFHLWKIDEVFSSADGKAQAIELSDPANGENHLAGHFISSNENKFNFPADLPTDATANHHFLIGTASYAALPGAVQPDYIIPDNFFHPSGDSFDYADVDSFSFTAGQVPTDGTNALIRDVNSGALSTGKNSETNLAGQTGSVTVGGTQANHAPTIDAIADPPAILPNAGQQTINLTGITAGAGETQNITVTATSDNTALIPNPTVTYTSPATTGTLRYTPLAGAQGSATITVTVKDDGGTAGGGNDTTVKTFVVTVGLTPPQAFVQHLFADVLGRQPDSGELANFAGQISDAASRATVARTLLTSSEHETAVVQAVYQALLGRAAESAALAYWLTQMAGGTDETALIASVAGSDEFFNHMGGSNESFVGGLYHALLGRVGEAQGTDYWLQLSGSETRSAIAQGFVGSAEFRGLLVDDPGQRFAALQGWFQDYFHRNADDAGRTFFAGELAGHTSANDAQIQMIASDEYFGQNG